MGLIRFFKKLFRKKVKAFAWQSFDEIMEGSKKGADIWGTDYPVPTSDTLYYKLLKRENRQFVITSIESKIFFFIPFTYDEYIIEIPWMKYTKESFTAIMALNEIHDAENWNITGSLQILQVFPL